MSDANTAALQKLTAHINSVFLGKPEAVELTLVCLLAEGHLLIEDVPGIGKTLLAKALARSLNCSFHRVQFTPDLLPSDLTGTSVYHQPTGEFIFRQGPIFANVILADEINRATPRTQSALLEAMAEQQVSADGKTLALERPFMVIATQNPFEFEGTYPLPENQLDRFALRLRIGYPTRQYEKDILTQHREGEPVDKLMPVVQREELLAVQTSVRQVRVDESLADYMLGIVEKTRERDDVYLGVGTRGALAFYRTAQALAFLKGRNYVTPDDIKRLAIPVLGHRIVSKTLRRGGGEQDAGDAVVKEILTQVPVPL
ncbi:MAG TPA: MoxR family ATPase [Gemmatales bacterium]|nr:MoxR family ATPase [Gemmatales bacterium]HMP60167.1 MoxR family ATPase [Gemmatales bacterium]